MNEPEKLTYDELEQIAERLLKFIACPSLCPVSLHVMNLHPKIPDFVKFLEINNRWQKDE